MKLMSLNCPNCNAALQVNSILSKAMCNFCGNEFIIDDESKKIEITNGKELGFQLEEGRLESIKYNRDTLLKLLQEIIGPLRDIENYNLNYQSKIAELSKIEIPEKISGIFVYGGGFILGCVLWVVFITLFARFGIVNKILVFIVAIISLVLAVFIVNRVAYSDYEKAKNRYEWLSYECNNLESKNKKAIINISDKINIIPPDYRNSTAVDAFYKYIQNGRANDMQQAVNLYEEELHRKKIENTQQALLRESLKTV